LRLKKITDAQQFADILDKPAIDANGDPIDKTLRDILSTRGAELQINDAVILQAEADSPKSGYETRQFYTLAVDEQGKTTLNTADNTSELDASVASITAAESFKRPVRTGYTGFLVGDGFPQNGYDFGHGIQFPETAGPDDFFLRTDFMPNRLFRFNGSRWVKVEDAVRMNMTNNDTRQTHTTGFINNTTHIYNEAVAIDWINLEKDISSFNTNIDYPATALYLVLKLDTVEIAFTIADHTGIITDLGGKIRITLPVINTEQQAIPYAGTWKLSLCNNREAQRQSLSKALRPKADL
jgi:hypothetical protein